MPVEVIFESGDPFGEALYSSPVTADDIGEHLRIAVAAHASGVVNSLIVFTDRDAPRQWFSLFMSSGARTSELPSARRAVVDPSRFFATAAVTRVLTGSRKPFELFTTREAAVAWLLADEPGETGDSGAGESGEPSAGDRVGE